ncbi:uncharacterized protein LOC144440994 isoform X2 [Glandiceps talaboti]
MAASGDKSAARKLADDFWEWRLRESPEFATMAGFHHYDDTLDSHSLDSFEKRKDDCRNFLSQIGELEKTGLSGEDKMNTTLMKSEIETYLEGMKYKGYLYPINFLEGQHLDFEKTVSYMKFQNDADYEKYISRLKKFPKQMEEIITLMKQGIKEGRTNNEYSMNGVVDQFDKMLQADPKESGFYQPFKDLSKVGSIPDERKKDLESEGLQLIKDNLFGSFAKLKSFISDEYVKNLRPNIGCSTLPDGANHYDNVLKFHITCDLTPRQVHDTGIQEVKRIKENMDKVMKKVGFEGDFKAFLAFLRDDKQFYYTSRDELMEGYRDIVENKIRPLLSTLFRNIPNMELQLKQTPEKEYNSPAAYYYAPSEDGSRPGTFFVNCNRFENHPRFEMIALCLHEGEPGHHFQICTAITSTLPSFQRHKDFEKCYQCPSHFLMCTSYVEGWGLYSEYLGEEMRLYEDDPYSLFGRYSMEILRACRLVVDTGMHALGWSREEAVKYMMENTAMADHNILSEIDRYITWPGQACAYKIGELKIKELRQKAEQELGAKFDVKAFHEAFLSCGPVPISVFEDVIDEYIKKSKQ